jgi:NitT/TauT family transport system substrate-binding protein
MRRNVKGFLLDAHIGRQMCRRRQALRLTPAGLAAATGVPADHLARLESGFTQATPHELALVAEALSARIAYFFKDFDYRSGYWAEREPVVIAHFTGAPFLPILVMERMRLIEKHGRRLGADLRVSYISSESAQKITSALLSGRAQFAATGVPAFLDVWDKTRDTVGVGAISPLSNAPLYLISRNRDVRSIRDFTPADRIAIRPGRTSVPSVLLRMAAADEFGREQGHALDELTVPIERQKAAKAVAAATAVNADFNFAPHSYAELGNDGARMVLRSDEILGGPATHNLLYSTLAYQRQKPVVVEAVAAASVEAINVIRQRRDQSFDLYRHHLNERHRRLAGRLARDNDIGFEAVPRGLLKYGTFMQAMGMIGAAPASEEALFLQTELKRRCS